MGFYSILHWLGCPAGAVHDTWSSAGASAIRNDRYTDWSNDGIISNFKGRHFSFFFSSSCPDYSLEQRSQGTRYFGRSRCDYFDPGNNLPVYSFIVTSGRRIVFSTEKPHLKAGDG